MMVILKGRRAAIAPVKVRVSRQDLRCLAQQNVLCCG